MKIDLNFHIEIYLKFSSIFVVGGIFASDFLVGGVYPTSKDGSALDYPSSSKISTFPNVWSSDLFNDIFTATERSQSITDENYYWKPSKLFELILNSNKSKEVRNPERFNNIFCFFEILKCFIFWRLNAPDQLIF